VILINLLPHREEKRQQRKRAFFVGLGVAAVIGVGITGLWFGVLQQLTSLQQERNDFLRAEITKLDDQIKDIATLRAEIDALKARQKAVEDLQMDRNVPVYLLNELVKQTPEGVFLTSIRQSGSAVTVMGRAQTNERVSEFLRNTAYSSQWLERPELVEIKAVDPPVRLGRDGDGPRADERAGFRVPAQHRLQLTVAGASGTGGDQGRRSGAQRGEGLGPVESSAVRLLDAHLPEGYGEAAGHRPRQPPKDFLRTRRWQARRQAARTSTSRRRSAAHRRNSGT